MLFIGAGLLFSYNIFSYLRYLRPGGFAGRDWMPAVFPGAQAGAFCPLPADQSFDRHKFPQVFLIDQGKCAAFRLCTRSTADPVHIILPGTGYIKIDDEVNMVNVNAPA